MIRAAGLAVVVTALLLLSGWQPASPAAADRVAMFGAIAQIACTMVGFMLAALAVVASISGTFLVRMMRKTGHYQDLLRTLFAGSAAFTIAGIMAVAALFGADVGHAFMAVLVGMHVAAVYSLIAAGRKFWLVLSNLADETVPDAAA